MPLNQLPEEILVLIFQQCGINDIFALRLTNRHFKETITTCAKSILPSSARITIPENDNTRLYLLAGTNYSIVWLKNLIPRYLAATLLSGPTWRCRIFLDWNAIVSDNELGDAFRDRLENGWRIIGTLSRISQNVYWPPMLRLATALNKGTWSTIQTSLSAKMVPGKTDIQDFNLVKRKEEMVLTRMRLFVSNMSQSDAADYMVTIRLLSKCLRYHPRFIERLKFERISSLEVQKLAQLEGGLPKGYNWPGKIPGTRHWYESYSTDSPNPIALWFTWFVLHIGPDAFWTQWTSPDPVSDHVSSLAWSLWENQDPRTKALRTQVADEVDLAIRKKCLKPGKVIPIDRVLRENIQRGTSDYGLFIDGSSLMRHPTVIDQWGSPVTESDDEEEMKRWQTLIDTGRHPREKVSFFVYLGRGEEIGADYPLRQYGG